MTTHHRAADLEKARQNLCNAWQPMHAGGASAETIAAYKVFSQSLIADLVDAMNEPSCQEWLQGGGAA